MSDDKVSIETKLPSWESQLLSRIVGLIGTQDNLRTSAPIYQVQRLRKIYGVRHDEDYSPFNPGEFGFHEWVEDGNTEDGPVDSQVAAAFDRLEAEGRPVNGYHKVYGIAIWEVAQSFFTRQSAECYLEGKLKEEYRIYVESGHVNQEWKMLRSLLLGATVSVTPIPPVLAFAQDDKGKPMPFGETCAQHYAYLLGLICEEGAEMMQVVSKIQRFGLMFRNPKTGVSNLAAFESEVKDLLAVLAMTDIWGGNSPTVTREEIEQKRQKILRWKVQGDEALKDEDWLSVITGESGE